LAGSEAWVPINSTVTTTTRAQVTTPQPVPSVPLHNTNQSIPVSLSAVPVSGIPSNSFSLPLHNVFDQIERTELELSMPMLEKVVSPVAHDVVHSVEVGTSHQASQEVLENPTVTVVTNPLLDSVKHNHVNHRDLGESPDGYIERAMHSSPLGSEDVRPDGAAQIGLTLRQELEILGIDDISEPLQDSVEHEHVSPRELVGSPKGAHVSVARPSIVKHVGMQAPLEVLSV